MVRFAKDKHSHFGTDHSGMFANIHGSVPTDQYTLDLRVLYIEIYVIYLQFYYSPTNKKQT